MKSEILNYIRSQGNPSTGEIAEELGLSESEVLKELQSLYKDQKITTLTRCGSGNRWEESNKLG